MSQALVLTLLLLALVLPIVGAGILRLAAARLSERQALGLAALFFGLAIMSVAVLARSEIRTLRIAGLTVLLADDGPPDFAPDIPLPTEPPIDDADHEQHEPPSPEPAVPTATSIAPSATPRPTTTPTATPTPEPTATPTTIPSAEPLTATPAPTQAGPRRYTVQPGDTLRSIAEDFGVSVQAILQANNLSAADADNLRQGQELIIP